MELDTDPRAAAIAELLADHPGADYRDLARMVLEAIDLRAPQPPPADADALRLALALARHSPDPNTKVGALIVTPGARISGWNQFPRGIACTPERLADREMKNRLIVHAEMHAVLSAARHGIPINHATLYLAATDSTGLVWGGPPCTRCCVELIAAGIKEVVSHPFKNVPSRWAADVAFAGTLLREAGVVYREVGR